MRSAAALLALVAVSPAGASPYEFHALPQGKDRPRVVFAPRPGSTACLTISFRVGTMEQTRPGMTRLAQNLIVYANRTVPKEKLSLALFDGAAELKISTGLRRSSFTLVAPSGSFDGLAQLLLQAVFSPKVDRSRAPLAVRNTLLEGEGLDEVEQLNFFLGQIMAPEDGRFQPRRPLDTDELVERAFPDAPRWFQTAFSPSNATLLFTGDVDVRAWTKRLNRFHGGTWKLGRDRPKLTTNIARKMRSKSELHLLVFPVTIDRPQSSAAVRLASAMLEDRLWQRFRQAGVGYTAEVRPLRTGWSDFLMLFLPAHDPSAISLAPFLVQEVRELRDGMTEEELERNRALVLKQLEATDGDPELLAQELELADGSNSWFGAEVTEAVRTVAPAELRKIYGRWLTEQNSIYLLFSPAKVASTDTSELKRGWIK